VCKKNAKESSNTPFVLDGVCVWKLRNNKGGCRSIELGRVIKVTRSTGKIIRLYSGKMGSTREYSP
jgi:hypothetical protein